MRSSDARCIDLALGCTDCAGEETMLAVTVEVFAANADVETSARDAQRVRSVGRIFIGAG